MQGVTPQNRHVQSVTHDFLSVHWDQKKPLLLGYSGGPDSKALLYTLLDLGVKPHIAHVDHGWRESSVQEAEALRNEAEALGCPFHTIRKEALQTEDAARQVRLEFFRQLQSEYAAILLAHTKNDLAETVLKRVLEGAHLTNLGGMCPVFKHKDTTLWRPLLKVSREEIMTFLSEKQLEPFYDSSNADSQYLRARMRKEIFPFLDKQFGKSSMDNLALLSKRSYELRKYLDDQTDRVPRNKGPWGTIFDLQGLEPFEIQHQIQKIAKLESLSFSRAVIETLLKWVLLREKNKQINVGHKKIFVDDQRIWVFLENSKGLESMCYRKP